MNANLAALLYLVVGHPLHSGAARAVVARDLPPGQSLRHDRHGRRGADDAGAAARRRARSRGCSSSSASPSAAAIGAWRARTIADDRDAAAGRDVPFAGRPRRGAGRRRRVLRARGLRHRGRRRHPPRQHHRDVARPRDRRGDLHRLDHRLPQARRPHVRRADPSAATPRHQRRARRRAHPPDRAFLRHPGGGVLLAHRARLARARRPAHHSDRRRRHAGRHLDAQLLFRLGGGGHRLHARQSRAHHHRRAGRLLGRDPLLHHVQGHEPLLHLGHPRRLGRRGRGPGGREGDPPGQAGLGRGRRLHDEERVEGDHRARLRHGGRAGAAFAARNGGHAEEETASRSSTRSIRSPAGCRAT